jgi:hypothetical protein
VALRTADHDVRREAAFAVTAYPFTRFTRLEIGAGRSSTAAGRPAKPREQSRRNPVDSTTGPVANYFDGSSRWCHNTLFAARVRRRTTFVSGEPWPLRQPPHSPTTGADPIIFNYLTIATRAYADLSIGPDETEFQKYIARPDYVRGYDRNSTFYLSCPVIGANPTNCSAVQLLGSRVAVANVELRFPLIRRVELGFLPIDLPPLDGLFFYDAGMAWSRGQTIYGGRPSGFDLNTARYPLRSYGAGLRLNLFNYAILRWDYAVPIDQAGHRGCGCGRLWPSF